MWCAVALAWCALAACYAPTPPSGAPCTSRSDCPDGLACLPTPDGDRCLPPGTSIGGDAPGVDDDAPIDGPSGGCTVLLDGTSSPTGQGWELQRAGSSTFTVGSNGTVLTTTGGASRQLLVLANALPASGAWTLDVELQFLGGGGHSAGNASFAIMSSFHEPIGDDLDRTRMVYVDQGAVGWGDANITVGLDTSVVRTYRLALQDTGQLRFSVVDGGVSIGGGAFTTNGTIAIGDQTSAAGLDSSVRVLSVARDCP